MERKVLAPTSSSSSSSILEEQSETMEEERTEEHPDLDTAVHEEREESPELEIFRSYISKKEELVTAQRACEDLEKNILH